MTTHNPCCLYSLDPDDAMCSSLSLDGSPLTTSYNDAPSLHTAQMTQVASEHMSGAEAAALAKEAEKNTANIVKAVRPLQLNVDRLFAGVANRISVSRDLSDSVVSLTHQCVHARVWAAYWVVNRTASPNCLVFSCGDGGIVLAGSKASAPSGSFVEPSSVAALMEGTPITSPRGYLYGNVDIELASFDVSGKNQTKTIMIAVCCHDSKRCNCPLIPLRCVCRT
jgi:hypothetical protein